MSNAFVIRALGLGVELNGRRVVDGVSLCAAGGTITAIVGPNGAGKTTLLRALAGLTPRTDGTLMVAGADPAQIGAAEAVKSRAYCAQRPACAWNFPLADLANITGRPDAFTDWLVKLSLEEVIDRRLAELSGGEQKAVYLAFALSQLAEPFGHAVLLDEPTDSLDLRRQSAVRLALRGLAQSGAACVIATHDFELARHCDRVLVLAESRLIAEGTPAETLTPTVIREVWGVDLKAIQSSH